jgi:tripartite-type tricarboxylate transporter receptor subunit TctC
LRELLDAARAKPGTVTNGSSGQGSVQHMTVELLANQAHVKFLQVPYKGEAPALTATLAGEVDFLVTTSTLVMPHVATGALRPLAVTSRKRWKDLPEVPTVEEAGKLSGFEVISWSGVAAPRGTPQPIVQRLNAEVRRAIAEPDVKARLEGFGGDVHASTPQEMRDQVAREVAKWTKLVRDANIEQE